MLNLTNYKSFSRKTLNSVTKSGQQALIALASEIDNVTFLNTESSIDTSNPLIRNLLKNMRNEINDLERNRMEEEAYLADYSQYIARAKRIFDCRSPIRKPTPGVSLQNEKELNFLRIRSTDAIFYYELTEEEDDDFYYGRAFLKIGDIVFPLHCENANFSETDIFREEFCVEYPDRPYVPFNRLMGDIIDFYEDYATEYGVKYGSPI